MALLGIASVFTLICCAVALRANARLRQEDRLPMQWWLDGGVTWSAPRPLALAFVPVLAACVLAAQAVLALHVPPRAGQEGMVLPTFMGTGLMFVAIQLIHLWLVGRTLRKNNG